jgi:alpha-ribazole phosphatase
MTRVILVRHGETADEDTKKVYKGTLDIPLSAQGVRTITATAEFLADFPLERVYTSALTRCVESGRIIAARRGLPVQTEPELNELHFGSWEGLSFTEIRERYPQQMQRWLADPVAHTPPGAEPLREAQARVMGCWRRLLDAHRDGTIALVIHAGIARIIICSLLDMDIARLFRLAQDCGCVDIIDVYRDGIAVLKLLNWRAAGPL